MRPASQYHELNIEMRKHCWTDVVNRGDEKFDIDEDNPIYHGEDNQWTFTNHWATLMGRYSAVTFVGPADEVMKRLKALPTTSTTKAWQ
jgi:hypothetical protein